jgi:translation initiation factor IF-3
VEVFIIKKRRRRERKPPMNYRIRARKVMVIDENKKNLGAMPRDDAIRLAKERGLDLVAVNIKAIPPVCKFLDYGKHLYLKHKQEKLAKRKQKTIQVKELKFGPKISEHDYNFKIKHAREFLTEEKKVKLTVKFRGREIIYADKGIELLNKMAKELEDVAVYERKPVRTGKIISIILGPKPTAKKKGGASAENKDQEGGSEAIQEDR